MPITPQGFEARRFTDIVEEINSDQKATIDSSLDTDPSTLLGTITSIFAASISDQEELVQAVADNFNIDKAEGTHLDDLVALVGITRLTAAPTSGRLEVTGDNLTAVPIGTEFSDGTNTFQSTIATVLAENQCTQVLYTLDTVVVGADYTITINNTTYSYTASVSDTVDTIFEALESDINTDSGNVFATASYDSDINVLTLDTNQLLVTLSIISSSLFTINSLTGVVFIENVVDGPVEVAADTVTSLVDPVTGISTVNNPIALNTGRLDESDEELRARQALSVRRAGTATVPAIRATLLELEGVTDVDVIENTLTVPDTEGRPGKSYEVVITGGVSTDIAQTIFDTKPAGVETYGDFLNIVNYEGTDYAVYFSRPVAVYIWAQIDYTLYDEEMFPANGEQGIADAFVEYGDSLNNDDDVIPKRSYQTIYSNVAGIEDLVVNIASSTSPTLAPNPSEYQEVTIPIGAKELAVFDTSRVEVNLTS